MSDFQTTANLDYNKVKVKAGFIGGLFAGKKIKRANQQIQEACNKTNPQVDKSNEEKPTYELGLDKDDEGNDNIGESRDEASEGTNTIGEGNNNIQEGQVIEVQAQELSEAAVVNQETFVQMETDALAKGDETQAQMAQLLAETNGAMVQIAANAMELDVLAGELEAAQAEEAGTFSTGMAAAGGQNSAYSLNVPTGGNQPSKAGKADKNQGGLIYSAQPQAQGNSQPQGSEGMPSTSSERTQQVFARLNQLQSETNSLADLVTNNLNAIQGLQIEVDDYVEPQQEIATEQVEEQNQNAERNQKIMEVFGTITTVGNAITLGGTVTKSVGIGMNAAGVGITVAGTAVKATGGVLKGVGAGLKSLGAALIGGVYTAPAGGAVTGAGAGVGASGVALTTTGTVVSTTGETLKASGNTVMTVGEGMQVAGKATTAVGSAGTMACNIADGNILGAITSGLQFLGSCAGVLNDAAAFSSHLGECASSFSQSINAFNSKINGLFSIGGMNASQALQGMGNAISGMQQTGFINGVGQQVNEGLDFSAQGQTFQLSAEQRSRLQGLNVPTAEIDQVRTQADYNNLINKYGGGKDKYEMQYAEKTKLQNLGATPEQIDGVNSYSDYVKLVEKLEAAKNGGQDK